VWDLGKGALLGELSGHEEGPHSSVIAPDGSLVATLSYSSAPQLRQLDPPQTVLALEGHRAVIDSLAFDHLGRLVVTASRDATVRVWDRRTGLALSVLRGHTAAVSAVEFRPDDQRLLTASRDGTARQWLTRPADVRASFPMHRGTIFSIDVTPDGRAVSGSRDKTVARFHAATGKMESRMSFEDPVGSVDLTNDGSRLLVATMQKVKLMDASGTTLAEKTLDRAYWRAVLLSPSEVLLGDGEGAIHWWDGVTTRKVREHHSAIQTLLFDEATGHVISGSEDAAIVWTRDLQVRTVVRDDQPMRGAAMDRAATRLITASASGSPKVWGLPGGALQRRLEGHNYGQWTGLFLHETLAATSGYDESMNVWDAATGKLLAAIPLNGQNVASITLFGEDLLLAGAENGEIWLFDLGLSHAEDWSKRAGCLSPYRLTGDKFVLAARECEPGTEDAIPGGGGRE
jgi:WD40 repeat protein